MLHINDLTYRIGGRVLLDNASISVADGHKVGLVGRNGTGKTTLFKMILGDITADDGSISVRPRSRIGTVAQEAPSGPESLLDSVLSADTERNALLEESETATDPGRIADIHTRLADIDAHTAPARAASILAGLGFDEAAQSRPCGDFSGGWRMRVALAATLFAAPDLLLLDEPTNHLDLEATLWLENYLAAWTGTLIVISHDRTLLNTVVDGIIHLQEKKLTRYAGGYDRFEKTRSERLANEAKMRTKQIAEQKHIQSFIDRFKAKATKARQAQSRVKMLARMQPIASVMEDRTVSFDFPTPDGLSPPLIALDDVAVGYDDDTPVLSGLDLRIDMDDRIALLGANGNGKSTMIKLLSGRLHVMRGRLTKSGKLTVGYFAQHQTDELSTTSTPLQTLSQMMPDSIESKVRAQLGRFGFGADKANTTIGDLSGGEKARLLFAVMSIHAPHILLLDEPTNHLDVDSREALVHALNEYAGAVILVSHDPHLIELVCDRLWLVNDGKCEPYDGDLGDYRQMLLDARRSSGRSGGKGNSGKSRKQIRQEKAQARAETANLRKTAKQAEAKVAKLEQRKAEMEARLANPEVYQGSTAKLQELQVKLGEVKAELAGAEETWMKTAEKIEASED
ncbi:MAG: ABC-F family ATP-binding cassette domain-containing protein [Alphaproteobacteria bacterium]